MTIHIRKCQGCKEERAEEEVLCGNCGWDLTLEPLRLPGQIDFIPETPIIPLTIRRCLNGHPLDQGDEMCFECGAAEAIAGECSETLELNETVIDGWSAIDQLENHSEAFETFIVERHGHRALLTFYFPDTHPDSTIYEVIKRLPKDYVPELLAHGEWQGRRYEVTDFIAQSTLLDLASTPIDLEMTRQIVKSVGRILSTLTENGLRHGNLRPENILISHQDPLSLLLTGFQFSRLSTFDLDTITQPISARYTAPEVIAGGISVASDWWSLGMIILQLITNGQCFDGINEKAFRIHVVTRGVSLPKGIDPDLNLLLRGLLARDPDHRWQWTQVQNWLSGEAVEAPSDSNIEEIRSGPALEFKEHTYVCPKAYALTAAEAANWEQAKDLLMRGVVATWLEDRKADSRIIAGIRLATSIDSIPEDFRHALALMWMNPSLPLIYQGEIVTSSWLLQNPIQGYEIITGPLVGHLRQMNRELHLCDLHDRIERARERAKILEIELSEESFRLLALASSRSNLERQWAIHRRMYPGSDHGGLNSLMDRQKITDEELMILLGASLQHYQPAEQILNQANTVASQAGLPSYDGSAAQQWFDISRKDLYREIEERIANYSRCGIPRVDDWANDFRIEHRISLPRALVLLSIPKESWQEPPRQHYVSTILEFFEKRTVSLAQKGPLVIMRKTRYRVDLAEVAGKKPTAAFILEHLISRVEAPLRIDRAAFENDSELEKKLRHLVSHARTYKRDTGIDSLYLGFPFLVMKDSRDEIKEKKPRIAPILLWPIKIDIENRDRVSILFDRDREEVRVNPAFTGLIGPEETKRWAEMAKELLGKSAIRIGDVIDAFGSLADPRERSLCVLPDSAYKVEAGIRQVVCSAVLFHAEFMGQAIGEDLRQMRKESPVGTALETALRVNKDPIITPSMPLIPEKERFFTMECDPSQEKAVFFAREAPGLLIEGPPGTGKSQTIVNIIGDCIGRNQTVLVVCQKSAALEVLAKRLDAEGLKDRYFYITHVNKDRTSVIQNLRIQVEGIVQAMRAYRTENVERERELLAEKIEKLEKEIDKHHEAIHTTDEVTGLSYRILLGQLIELEDQIKLIDVPALRRLLKDFDQKQLTEIEETCSPIGRIWLESCFEGNPLEKLNVFSPDSALINEFKISLFAFIDKEKKRDEIFRQSAISFDVEDIFPHKEWIKRYESLFNKVDWRNISSWFQFFPQNGQSDDGNLIQQLEELKTSLHALDLKNHDPRLSEDMIQMPVPIIKKRLTWAKSYNISVSLLNPEKQLKGMEKNRFSIVGIWLEASFFEGILLEKLKPFSPDTILLGEFLRSFSAFLDKEEIRKESMHQLIGAFDIEDPSCHQDWIKSNESLFNKLEWRNITSWFQLFPQNGQSEGDSLIQRLEELKATLYALNFKDHDPRLSVHMIQMPLSIIKKLFKWAKSSVTSVSFIGRLNPLRYLNSKRIQRCLSNFGEMPTQERIVQLQNAAKLELQLRPLREAIQELSNRLYYDKQKSMSMSLQELQLTVDRMIEELYLAQRGIQALHACPRQEEIEPIAKIGVLAYQDLISRYSIAFERHRARSQSMDALNRLSQFFSEELFNQCQTNIRNNRSNLYCLERLNQLLPSLASYQKFRLNSSFNLTGKHVQNLYLCLPAYQTMQLILRNMDCKWMQRILKLQNAAKLELQQRPIREAILELSNRLYEKQPLQSLTLKDLRLLADRMLEELYLAEKGIHALHTCPLQKEVEQIVETGFTAYKDLINRYGIAFERHQARSQSIDALERLSPFFSIDMLEHCKANIRNNRSNLYDLQILVEALPSLPAYQEFRLQAPNLSPEFLKIFATLREKDKELREYPSEELEMVIRRIIGREARLAWKDRIEQSFPILRLAQKELTRKIQTLAESNTKIRTLNQKFLAFNIDIWKVVAPKDWEDITRLKGQRARRLREVIERGWDMGLGRLRPVWLMNPDTASQLLPLRAGMFDLIIFDEASQIPVENALPTLYRAKRTVISGDEKQMPPTSVFMKRIVDEEESSSMDEDLDEMISDAERDALKDTWNRREIKDCSDLLTLGKTVLPRSMLQIHYRSKYRELIAYSNAAFYGNKLSVPVRHPENVIQNIRPIEVIRVDGVYANQTNRKEAERVVELLAERWSSPERPSIGVVTFNAKQAELIEDVLAERADQDAFFRQALGQERVRQQGGEDMSFFVKNVENVQGDERDVIIFSSTFGRNEQGTFQRQFGPLSQKGGERRLNVAITRAREKIILITSLPINEISDALSKSQGPKNSRDFLQAYFDYASKISDGSLEAARKSLENMASENPSIQRSSNFDKDGFTRSVAAFIKSLGLKPSTIKENDAFGLDFVIEDPEKKRFGIGIECDAHCHPILETARAREVWRPKVLRMEIPIVHRVTSFAWYHRRKEEMKRLKHVLEEALGVKLSGERIKSDSGG